MNSVLGSIRQFQYLDRDFRLVRSSGKYNELCKLLSFILNYSKISTESLKLILEHTVDSLSENAFTFPIMISNQLPNKNSQNPPERPSTSKLVPNKINQTQNERKTIIPDEEIPKSFSSVITSPPFKSNEFPSKSLLPQKAILKVSFTSPNNESIQKKLEKSKFTFSQPLF